MYVVSECLLGVKCKYNGGHNLSPDIVEFLKDKEYITVCPETMGGLQSPRPPAEIQPDGRVVNKEGKDVTAEFEKGAALALKKVYAALMRGAGDDCCAADFISEGRMLERSGAPVKAILKANSPSCGCGRIYDGTFSGTLKDGDGLTASLFRRNGIELTTEKDFADSKFEGEK